MILLQTAHSKLWIIREHGRKNGFFLNCIQLLNDMSQIAKTENMENCIQLVFTGGSACNQIISTISCCDLSSFL